MRLTLIIRSSEHDTMLLAVLANNLWWATHSPAEDTAVLEIGIDDLLVHEVLQYDLLGSLRVKVSIFSLNVRIKYSIIADVAAIYDCVQRGRQLRVSEFAADFFRLIEVVQDGLIGGGGCGGGVFRGTGGNQCCAHWRLKGNFLFVVVVIGVGVGVGVGIGVVRRSNRYVVIPVNIPTVTVVNAELLRFLKETMRGGDVFLIVLHVLLCGAYVVVIVVNRGGDWEGQERMPSRRESIVGGHFQLLR